MRMPGSVFLPSKGISTCSMRGASVSAAKRLKLSSDLRYAAFAALSLGVRNRSPSLIVETRALEESGGGEVVLFPRGGEPQGAHPVGLAHPLIKPGVVVTYLALQLAADPVDLAHRGRTPIGCGIGDAHTGGPAVVIGKIREPRFLADGFCCFCHEAFSLREIRGCRAHLF